MVSIFKLAAIDLKFSLGLPMMPLSFIHSKTRFGPISSSYHCNHQCTITFFSQNQKSNWSNNHINTTPGGGVSWAYGTLRSDARGHFCGGLRPSQSRGIHHHHYQDHILITIINMIMIITSVEAFVLLNKEVFMSIRLYIDNHCNHYHDLNI